MNNFDVIVIGAGHAGVEAAYAAAKMGSKTLLITLDLDKIALMPCNPSIGGLGKGHITYEVSALGGLMPKLCTKTYLQARMLNTRKGPAVQGLRLQIHKYEYSKQAKQELLKVPNLTLQEGMVVEILHENSGGCKKITGVKTQDNQIFGAKGIVVTTGTFLNGLIHIGFDKQKGGRRDEKGVEGLTASLENVLGAKLGRLKTGTPPRLLRSSINFDEMQKQESEKLEYLYEFDAVIVEEKIPCYITNTNEKTHEILRKNFSRSALFGGQISGIGPRYCPSIEDKVRRHPDRNSHHVFIEPDGENLQEVYPAGLSTSMPLDVQNEYIHSIQGLEQAVIVKPGYAIEYDFLQPSNLKHTLEAKNVGGLFFAGQINGTTGYEEAAGQGIIAGINAHLKHTNQEPFILDRTQGYIGVMIDDLITLGVDEPYRIFTSRAERRLLLRQDNVFLRLMPYGKKFGLIDDELYEKFLQEKTVIEKSINFIQEQGKSSEIFRIFHSVDFTDEVKQEATKKLFKLWEQKNFSGFLSSRTLFCIHAEIRYDGYIEKEKQESEKIIRFQNLQIPDEIVYSKMPGLSVELQQKLNHYKPKTIAQAQLIPGMTPAALSVLIFQSREL
jgi:tRNA uridine 5-carboxymethylaminomethyl modification enzyme